MTMKELSQLHWLNVEIDRDKQRLAELEARATSPVGRICPGCLVAAVQGRALKARPLKSSN